MPNPNPTLVHAAAKVSVDDVRNAFYRQAPNDRTWIREFRTEPRELIVADDGSGGVARVGFEIGDDGTITFAAPKKVRVEYVEDDADEKVAASRLVYASAAESRPSTATAPPTPPGFVPSDVRAADDHWKRQPRDREGQWTDTPGGGGSPFRPMLRVTPAERREMRRRFPTRNAPGEGAADVPLSQRGTQFGDRDPLDRPTPAPSRPRRSRSRDAGRENQRREREQQDMEDEERMRQALVDIDEDDDGNPTDFERAVEEEFALMVDERNRQRRERDQARTARETQELQERERQLGRDGDLPQRDAYESILEEAESVLRQRFGGPRANQRMANQIQRLRESLADGDHDGAYGAGTSLMEILEPFLSRGEIPTLRRPGSGFRMRPVRAAAVSDRPWSDYSESDYTPDQWRRATILDRGAGHGDESTKGRYALPVRQPDGTLNRNGVHAAAGGHGIGAVKGISPELRRATARKLARLYRQIGDEPPASLLSLAGMSPSASADPHNQTPAAEPGNPTNEEEIMPLSTEVYQRLGLAEDAEADAVNAAVLALADKAEKAPDPQQVAAAAAENETLTQKVTLLSEQVESLSKQIADDNAAKAAEVKASVLEEAVTKGRIAPADREKWEQRYDKAPDAVADVLASIADGAVVPVSVHGKVGDPWDVAAAGELPPEPEGLFSNPEPAMAGASNEED